MGFSKPSKLYFFFQKLPKEIYKFKFIKNDKLKTYKLFPRKLILKPQKESANFKKPVVLEGKQFATSPE